MMTPEGPDVLARFEDHVGELAVALEANTLEELFTEAARVVSRECGETEDAPGPWERVALSARDAATLLVDWLNELIGRSEVESRAYADVRGLAIDGVSVSCANAAGVDRQTGTGTERDRGTAGEARLEAEIRGRPVSRWTSAIKAATYHGLELEQRDGRWQARVLFDV